MLNLIDCYLVLRPHAVMLFKDDRQTESDDAGFTLKIKEHHG